MRYSEPAPVSVPRVPADDTRSHCETTGTAAMPTRTTVQGPGAAEPATSTTHLRGALFNPQVDRVSVRGPRWGCGIHDEITDFEALS